ncbi:hypothetical protein FQA47_009940 [Oryzias melastigma]|uniref:Uncharacterized protein n=1 Tax=Oryzias melastigma TaxID=30732 RepID=A0A834CU53_ORYME|nr:hypothetical protein FQA47_009940 [Oryzias melastigma]
MHFPFFGWLQQQAQTKAVHGKVSLGVTLSISRFCHSLLILIEREKRRLWKWGRLRRRGASQQAKGSTDIHGNLQIYSAAIISINAERQWGPGEFRLKDHFKHSELSPFGENVTPIPAEHQLAEGRGTTRAHTAIYHNDSTNEKGLQCHSS